MCVICISQKGVRQPNDREIMNMWTSNPHGAGYMTVKDGKVEVHKGFMNLRDFTNAIVNEHFTDDDVVVYHFRISTQGGVNPEMTQPFFWTKDIEQTKVLDASASLGIAHNGIIPITTDRTDKEYSDTAHFVAEYLPHIIHKRSDLSDGFVQNMLAELLQSKMVFLDSAGHVTMIGNFMYDADSKLVYSNSSYRGYKEFTRSNVNRQSRFSFA